MLVLRLPGQAALLALISWSTFPEAMAAPWELQRTDHQRA